MKTTAFRIEPATEADVPVLLRFIRSLAEYERLANAVTATEEELRSALFAARPAAEAIIGYAGDEPAGFALFFHNFSTFVGRRGLYLEDLFVQPKWRGHGLGRRLLAELARIAIERGCGRMEWSVLDWNTPSIAFYRALGAQAMADWTVYRLTGEPLRRLASKPEDA
jgi:GNAT superfamily N-acetyltransferase